MDISIKRLCAGGPCAARRNGRRPTVRQALLIGLAAIGLTVAAPASATLLSFNIEWSGASFGNDAAATGMLTVDDTIFPNGANVFRPPASIGITDFMITITGASGGNGTFVLTDFILFAWDTGGVALDLTQELVGQATTNGLWGGDGAFSFFRGNAGAPTGAEPFAIRPAGSDDLLQLISFAPKAQDVSEPGVLALFGAAA